MAKYPNDDLFEGTKMSFGEHLEELRVRLFKAVLFLVLGFAVGLLLAEYVMNFMQSPLTAALENYYIDKAVTDLEKEYPGHVTQAVAKVVAHNRLVFDYQYYEVNEIGRIQTILDEERVKAASAEQETTDENSVPEESKTAESESDTARSEVTPPVATSLEVVGQEIPAPTSNLIRARVWKPVKMKVTSLSAQEAFMIWMKAGLITGIVVASPFVFYQVWQFVAAGLYPHEKNYVFIYLPFSLLLFLAGAAMAFGFVFKPVLDFLFSFNKSLNIDPDPRISEWLGFVLILPLGFGISFQLPLVMLFLNRIGLIALETYIENWRVSILAIFVISAVLTPADPISIFLMAGPLTVLYFLGLAMCKWIPKQKSPFAGAYEP